MINEILIYVSIYVALFLACFYALSLLDGMKVKKPEMPKKLPFVSVIIPAYNEEKGIKGSIEAALNLEYPKNKIEIIVVDDGSKDKTYEKASKFRSNKNVKIFKLKKNGGKGAAMNYGIGRSKGKIIVTMDADNTLPVSDSLKKIIPYFSRPETMCVSPALAIYKPKGILQRVQQVEYLFGVFLRKAFCSINSIHITPGAFSVYRRSFFEKHGYFDEDNLTEDMEMAFRIQYNGYVVDNNPDAVVYAIAPNKFVPLMKQRRRWYAGLFHNLVKYKRMFSRKYGVLGLLILPMVVFSVILSMIVTSWIVISMLKDLRAEFFLWKSVEFNVLGSLDLSMYFFRAFFVDLLTNPIMIFFLLTLVVFVGYMVYAKTKVKEHANIKLSIFFFLAFFMFLYAFWWAVAMIYVALNKEISWR